MQENYIDGAAIQTPQKNEEKEIDDVLVQIGTFSLSFA